LGFRIGLFLPLCPDAAARGAPFVFMGPRRTITLFFCAAFAGSVVLGMAPNAYVAVVGRALIGLGVAMLFVPSLNVPAEWFRVKEFAMMTGILMAMGGIGSYSAAARC